MLRDGDFGVPRNRERIYIIGISQEHYNVPDDYDFSFLTSTYESTMVFLVIMESMHMTVVHRLMYYLVNHERLLNNRWLDLYLKQQEPL